MKTNIRLSYYELCMLGRFENLVLNNLPKSETDLNWLTQFLYFQFHSQIDLLPLCFFLMGTNMRNF